MFISLLKARWHLVLLALSIPALLQWKNPLGPQTVIFLRCATLLRCLPGTMSWVLHSNGWLKFPILEMNPKHLIPILVYLSQIPVPSHNEALDAVPWIGVFLGTTHTAVTICKSLMLYLLIFIASVPQELLRLKFVQEMQTCPEPCSDAD